MVARTGDRLEDLVPGLTGEVGNTSSVEAEEDLEAITIRVTRTEDP